jgi:hypothetical protein
MKLLVTYALHFAPVLIAPNWPVLLSKIPCGQPCVARTNIDISIFDLDASCSGTCCILACVDWSLLWVVPELYDVPPRPQRKSFDPESISCRSFLSPLPPLSPLSGRCRRRLCFYYSWLYSVATATFEPLFVCFWLVIPNGQIAFRTCFWNKIQNEVGLRLETPTLNRFSYCHVEHFSKGAEATEMLKISRC